MGWTDSSRPGQPCNPSLCPCPPFLSPFPAISPPFWSRRSESTVASSFSLASGSLRMAVGRRG